MRYMSIDGADSDEDTTEIMFYARRCCVAAAGRERALSIFCFRVVSLIWCADTLLCVQESSHHHSTRDVRVRMLNRPQQAHIVAGCSVPARRAARAPGSNSCLLMHPLPRVRYLRSMRCQARRAKELKSLPFGLNNTASITGVRKLYERSFFRIRR